LAQNLTSIDIVKHFAGVTALSSGCLIANSGEVMGLIGANGSGKSTLCKIITGVVAPDEGQLLLHGTPISFSTPLEALNSSIAAVYQELSLVPSLTIAQNIWLTREPITLVNELPPDERQIVEILKAVSTNPRIIILDEATSSLDNRQVDRLFNLIGEWKKQDKVIIFISHRMSEVFRIADRITVLRNGKTIGDFDSKKVKEKDLINLMVENAKDHLEKTDTSISKQLGETVLKVTNLRTLRLKGVDFEVKKGELLGIAGLQGQFKHTSQSMAKDIALVPGDRAKEGLLMRLSILENIMLPSWMKYGFPLNTGKAKKDAAKTSKSLKIIMADLNMPVSSLSGGNAQKVVIGKWLQRKPRVLLLNDPTKGVDVGTKKEFYDLLKELCEAGTSILFYSSDDEELVGLCDRVLVMRDGKIRKELPKLELTLSSLITASVTSSEELAHAAD